VDASPQYLEHMFDRMYRVSMVGEKAYNQAEALRAGRAQLAVAAQWLRTNAVAEFSDREKAYAMAAVLDTAELHWVTCPRRCAAKY
jgi:hypothetical protein